MLYQREIDDSVLIQFIILFTLHSSDAPLGYDDLLNLVLENCNISYTDFQLALHNLTSTNHVSVTDINERCDLYEITKKGLNTADFFNRIVPVYIREPIKDSIKQMFIDKRRKNAVRSNIVPTTKNGDYRTECSLYDDDKLQLMELNLFVGARDDAEKMARFFKEHPQEIYEQIIMLMTGYEKNETTT